jgi:hypothetical protein
MAGKDFKTWKIKWNHFKVFRLYIYFLDIPATYNRLVCQLEVPGGITAWVMREGDNNRWVAEKSTTHRLYARSITQARVIKFSRSSY